MQAITWSVPSAFLFKFSNFLMSHFFLYCQTNRLIQVLFVGPLQAFIGRYLYNKFQCRHPLCHFKAYSQVSNGAFLT